MIGLKESFRLIYSNTHLRTRETLPLIKHYGIVGTAESRITLLKVPNFVRQPHIHKLGYRGRLMIQNYSKSGYCNSKICFLWPKMKKMMTSFCVYQCIFQRHLELQGNNKNCNIQNCADYLELQGHSYAGSSFVDCQAFD